MEGLTRLVSESLARHGFDRPLDYRRLHWSRWFRCETHHSLLSVPSKPGVFAVAEEVMDLDRSSGSPEAGSRKPEAESRRMLAVTQFYEDDDMAFVLDRMISYPNPMRDRLASGRYFVRFVVIEDRIQRRSICSALNQWMLSAAEKATGIGSHFATSLELAPATEYVPAPNEVQPNLFEMAQPGVGRTLLSANADVSTNSSADDAAKSVPLSVTAPQLDSGAATNIHCPSPFPSGF